VKLYEYQAKELLSRYGVPVPRGWTASTPDEAAAAAARAGKPVMVKAQVLVGGRGKAGGVKPAVNPEECRRIAREILGMRIKGIEVKTVLVAESVDIEQEFYLSLAVDRAGRTIQCIASASGGMEIEEVAATHPQNIVRFPAKKGDFSALSGVFPSTLILQAQEAASRMLALFRENDCSLVEINPYARTPDGRLMAADAKVILDDNALFLHPELEKLRSPEEYSADEMQAKAAGLSFVSLEGTIGCIVNGAGLSMATMDLIKYFGSSPANFLDVGGSSNPDKVVAALKIILKNPRLKAILINIFGGITRCDDIARGILSARSALTIPVPLVIRLIGTNEKEGRALLKVGGIDAYEDLTDAVKAAVAAGAT
jgi:succinyl-CoA synthetase beta subunit